MFIVQEEITETLDWPVRVSVPKSGGSNRTYEFTGTFKRLNVEQKKAQKELKEANNYDESEWLEAYLDFVMGVMVGWHGVVTPDRQPLPFTRENLRKVVAGPDGTAVINAITAAMVQIDAGVKAKN